LSTERLLSGAEWGLLLEDTDEEAGVTWASSADERGLMVPDWRRSWSTNVVLPWSTVHQSQRISRGVKSDNIPWAIMAMFLMFSAGIRVPLASAISAKTFREEAKDRIALYRGLAQALHALDQTMDLSIRGG